MPAEIGHAPYAAPLLEFLASHFDVVKIIAIRDKLFPKLSEDCWLLYADGFGGATSEVRFTFVDQFIPSPRPPGNGTRIALNEWRHGWNCRLRPFLLSSDVRSLYQHALGHPGSRRFGMMASVGIGYVSGANGFFHLRPSEAERWQIPADFLHPSVRKSRMLPPRRLTRTSIDRWRRLDEPMLLLRIRKSDTVPQSVQRYLDTEAGRRARTAYKCRTRHPWYSVPDVRIPDFFLTYMSGRAPLLVRNSSAASCTNTVHAVHVHEKKLLRWLTRTWETSFVRMSCEIEGHPLGGGMLKLEPREAARVLLPDASLLPGCRVGKSTNLWPPCAPGGTMPPGSDGPTPRRRTCEWITRRDALRHFATYDGPTRSQQHIKPLHWYVTCRLVLEGGFHPDELTPRPPFTVKNPRGRHVLHHTPETATGAEATILGGLKTKNVDIVVDKPGVGPVLAVSCKGMTGAFRNLTNRMEETIGECTNLHIRYPALVFGYFFVIRANRISDVSESPPPAERRSRQLGPNDIALDKAGKPVETISRFHAALGSLTGRDGIRSDPSRYEAISLAMVDVRSDHAGELLDTFPPLTSPLRLEHFFDVLYRHYDERNVVSAPDLATRNRRIEWSPDSPALTDRLPENLDYDIRISN